MKIDITNKQYRNLIIMSGIANSVLGFLDDSLEESDYKSQSNEMEKLEEYLLQFAKDFGCQDLTEEFEGEKFFDDEMYEKMVMPIIGDYDDCIVFDELANKLAWRDFRRDHTDAEIKKIGEKSGGYIGLELYDYENKYWDEFEKNGCNRLEIKIN